MSYQLDTKSMYQTHMDLVFFSDFLRWFLGLGLFVVLGFFSGFVVNRTSSSEVTSCNKNVIFKTTKTVKTALHGQGKFSSSGICLWVTLYDFEYKEECLRLFFEFFVSFCFSNSERER